MGNCKLNGCELCRFVPSTSWAFMEPVIVICPETIVLPTATVPSWQLKHKIAVGAEHRLLAFLMIGSAVIDLIGRLGLCLVPQRHAGRQSGVRSVAVGTRSRARAGDRRLAAGREIMGADHIAGDLRQQGNLRPTGTRAAMRASLGASLGRLRQSVIMEDLHAPVEGIDHENAIVAIDEQPRRQLEFSQPGAALAEGV